MQISTRRIIKMLFYCHFRRSITETNCRWWWSRFHRLCLPFNAAAWMNFWKAKILIKSRKMQDFPLKIIACAVCFQSSKPLLLFCRRIISIARDLMKPFSRAYFMSREISQVFGYLATRTWLECWIQLFLSKFWGFTKWILFKLCLIFFARQLHIFYVARLFTERSICQPWLQRVPRKHWVRQWSLSCDHARGQQKQTIVVRDRRIWNFFTELAEVLILSLETPNWLTECLAILRSFVRWSIERDVKCSGLPTFPIYLHHMQDGLSQS